MNCHEARRLFSLYYDSEGDAGLQLEIGDHVAVCPECQQWFSRQSHCEDTLVHMLSTGDATPPTWEAIESQVLASARPYQQLVRFRFWTAGTALMAMAAALLVAVVLWRWPQANQSITDLSQLAAVEHERYVEGRWQAEV